MKDIAVLGCEQAWKNFKADKFSEWIDSKQTFHFAVGCNVFDNKDTRYHHVVTPHHARGIIWSGLEDLDGTQPELADLVRFIMKRQNG